VGLGVLGERVARGENGSDDCRGGGCTRWVEGWAQAERGKKNGFPFLFIFSFYFILFYFEFKLKCNLPFQKVHHTHMHQQE
jgi:hypothetical protein